MRPADFAGRGRDRALAAVQGCAVGQPPRRLRSTGHREVCGANGGCAFFGYFLCANKESTSPAGRDPQLSQFSRAAALAHPCAPRHSYILYSIARLK
jgi:hypothetical protein